MNAGSSPASPLILMRHKWFKLGNNDINIFLATSKKQAKKGKFIAAMSSESWEILRPPRWNKIMARGYCNSIKDGQQRVEGYLRDKGLLVDEDKPKLSPAAIELKRACQRL